MSRENDPRNDRPDPLMLGLFVLLLTGLVLGSYVWLRSYSLKIDQLQDEKPARATAAQASQLKQLVATPTLSGETDGNRTPESVSSEGSRDLEAEVIHLERENAALRQELRTLNSKSTVEP